MLTNSGLIAIVLILLSLNFLIQAQIIPLASSQINTLSFTIIKMDSCLKWFSNLSLFLSRRLAAWTIVNHACPLTNPTAPPASSLFWVRMAFVRRIAVPASSDLGSSAEAVPWIATLVTQKPHAASVLQDILCLIISAILHAHRHSSMKWSFSSAYRAPQTVWVAWMLQTALNVPKVTRSMKDNAIRSAQIKQILSLRFALSRQVSM